MSKESHNYCINSAYAGVCIAGPTEQLTDMNNLLT